MWLLVPVVLSLTRRVAVLSDAKGLIERYKPVSVGSYLFSKNGLHRYAHALSQLEEEHTTALVTDAMDVFVARIDGNATRLTAVLWHAPHRSSRILEFLALREWHSRVAPDADLDGSSLDDDDDRALWQYADILS